MRRLVMAMMIGLASPAGAVPPAEARAVLDGAFRDAQMALVTRTALSLSGAARRLGTADPAGQAVLREEQAALAALAEAEAADAHGRAEGGGAPAAVVAARARLARARAALPPRPPAADIAPVPLDQTQALLGPDEALLLVQPTEQGSYLFALDRRRVLWRRSALTAAALAGEVAALRRALDPAGLTRSGEDAAPPAARRRGGFPRMAAWRLHRSVWAPGAAVLGRARTVYVVAGGALGALPPALLVERRPTGDDGDPAALRRTAWLVRRHALVALPSVTNLRALRLAGRHRPATVPFAGFGAPLPNPLAPALPPLPSAAAELAAMAGALGAGPDAIATGAAATEAAVARAPLGGVGVVAFATHGLRAGVASAEPTLVLSPPAAGESGDGLLDATEAAALTLDADWVVLSACDTGAGDPAAGGEALSGLARGFFAAGARAVLASLWRVRDDAVEALTVGALTAWRRDPAAGRAVALRRAMLAMLDDRAHPERADPTYWAAMVLAGEGR